MRTGDGLHGRLSRLENETTVLGCQSGEIGCVKSTQAHPATDVGETSSGGDSAKGVEIVAQRGVRTGLIGCLEN